MKYQAINGWTKATMKKQITENNNGKPALNDLESCAYLAADGNKCGVGCFIPDGHKAQISIFAISDLIYNFPCLQQFMPLGEAGLRALQRIHDAYAPWYSFIKEPTSRAEGRTHDNVRDAMLHWIDQNVIDGDAK